MRFFYDTEFIEDGSTIDLVSIGVVAEDGAEFYAVSSEFARAKAGPWVARHVLPKLPEREHPAWRSRARIRAELLEFIGKPADGVQLWAWLAAYDHVVLAQLWGAMPDLPRQLPRFTRDLRQRWEDLGKPKLPPAPAAAHDALADARHNRERWFVLERERRRLGLPGG